MWRASRPAGAELEQYRALLAQGLVRPTALEIFLMNADGTHQRPLTRNGAANFCPTFHPDGRRILYASNAGTAGGREFDLWILDKTGRRAGARHRGRRASTASRTSAPTDASSCGPPTGPTRRGRETNLFIARWVD